MTSRLPPHLAALARAPSSGRGGADAGRRPDPSAPRDPAAHEAARFAGAADDLGPLTRQGGAPAVMAKMAAELADFGRRRLERNLRTWERLGACRNPVEAVSVCLDASLSAAAQYADEAATLARLGRGGAAARTGTGPGEAAGRYAAPVDSAKGR